MVTLIQIYFILGAFLRDGYYILIENPLNTYYSLYSMAYLYNQFCKNHERSHCFQKIAFSVSVMLSFRYSVIFLLHNLHLDIVSADTSHTEFISQLKKQNFTVCPIFSIISNPLHIQNN